MSLQHVFHIGKGEMSSLLPNSIPVDRFSFLDDEVGDDDIALVPFSSGTTGLPKGVELTHGNLTAQLSQIRYILFLKKAWLFFICQGQSTILPFQTPYSSSVRLRWWRCDYDVAYGTYSGTDDRVIESTGTGRHGRHPPKIRTGGIPPLYSEIQGTLLCQLCRKETSPVL